jgi:hypothetical protein
MYLVMLRRQDLSPRRSLNLRSAASAIPNMLRKLTLQEFDLTDESDPAETTGVAVKRRVVSPPFGVQVKR